jgi:hypothetical protein
LEQYREIPIQREQHALAMAWTTNKLFLGHTVDYEMHDLASAFHSQATTLFTREHSRPHILVMPDELLLVSGIVGIFVNFEGQITRGSIAWSDTPLVCATCVLSMCAC